jgi:hypothetical protein
MTLAIVECHRFLLKNSNFLIEGGWIIGRIESALLSERGYVGAMALHIFQ